MKLVLKRAILVLIILLYILTLSGCWNRRELEELGIIGAAGADYEDNKFIFTFEVIKPKPVKAGGGGVEESPVRYIQSTGVSVFEAIRNVTLKFDKKIFWPHTNVYIFGEDAARKGMTEYIDVFNRDHEMRKMVHIIITKGTTAAEIMGIKAGIEDLPAQYIDSLISNQKSNAKSVEVHMLDFLNFYYSDGIEPVIGVIQKNKKTKIGTEDKEEYELSTEGLAVFLDDRLVGFLDGDETLAYNLVIGKVKSATLVSATPDGKGVSSLEVLKTKSKNDVELKDGSVKINVKINISSMLGEESGIDDLKRLEVISALEKSNSKVIKDQVENTIKKVQEDYESDIFGFGQIVHRKYPKQWKSIKTDWNEMFSNAEIKVDVESKIISTGLANVPVKKQEVE